MDLPFPLVKNRDGTRVQFSQAKIYQSIQRANASSKEKINIDQVVQLVLNHVRFSTFLIILQKRQESAGRTEIDVDKIIKYNSQALKDAGFKTTASQYADYVKQRTLRRFEPTGGLPAFLYNKSFPKVKFFFLFSFIAFLIFVRVQMGPIILFYVLL